MQDYKNVTITPSDLDLEVGASFENCVFKSEKSICISPLDIVKAGPNFNRPKRFEMMNFSFVLFKNCTFDCKFVRCNFSFAVGMPPEDVCELCNRNTVAPKDFTGVSTREQYLKSIGK